MGKPTQITCGSPTLIPSAPGHSAAPPDSARDGSAMPGDLLSLRRKFLAIASWLVVFCHPSEKAWISSVGMIILNIWKNKVHVWNHEAARYFSGEILWDFRKGFSEGTNCVSRKKAGMEHIIGIDIRLYVSYYNSSQLYVHICTLIIVLAWIIGILYPSTFCKFPII